MARRLGVKTLDERQDLFLAQAYEDYAPDETPELDSEGFAALLAEAWKAAEARVCGSPAEITVRPLRFEGDRSGYDLVQIIQDDSAFLVDSVMGELAEAGV